jgi:hypothetical protein
MTFNPRKSLLGKADSARKVWVELPEAPGLEVWITSSRNPAFEQALSRLKTPDGADSPPVGEIVKLTAAHLIHGWRGLELEDGKQEEFSHEKAAELFDEYRDLWIWVSKATQALTVEDVRRADTTAGN